jgi:hypothetical protein
VVWRNGRPDTDAITDILKFNSWDCAILGFFGRLPLVAGFLTLGWMTLRARPFGLLAMLEAGWRAWWFKRFGRGQIQSALGRINDAIAAE